MPDLRFQVESAQPVPYSVTPVLGLRLRIENQAAEEDIRSILLQCQIRIETTRRPYNPIEQKRLADLFGEPARWSQTLRSMLWTNGSVVVPAFRSSTTVELPLPCTFDLTVASAKYFNGLDSGAAPLTLLFSGSVFYASDEGLQVTQIPWNQEASYALPVLVWKQMMDAYYPNVAWLGLRRDVFERLNQYKVAHGIATWEQTLESMLP